jgi:hypothetical protein
MSQLAAVMVKLALHELRSAYKYNRKASTDDFICKLRAHPRSGRHPKEEQSRSAGLRE